MVGSQPNLANQKNTAFRQNFPGPKKHIFNSLKKYSKKMCALSESDIKINSFTSGFFLFYRNINLVKKLPNFGQKIP